MPTTVDHFIGWMDHHEELEEKQFGRQMPRKWWSNSLNIIREIIGRYSIISTDAYFVWAFYTKMQLVPLITDLLSRELNPIQQSPLVRKEKQKKAKQQTHCTNCITLNWVSDRCQWAWNKKIMCSRSWSSHYSSRQKKKTNWTKNWMHTQHMRSIDWVCNAYVI